MRKLLTILFILLLQNSFAQTTHYIDPTGSDANNGTIGSPWKTLYYAATQVTTPGDTIYVNAGTYIETQAIKVGIGISIKGAGRDITIVKSHYKTIWGSNYPEVASIYFNNPTQGTNGNQSLSNITLDGDNLTGTTAILIKRTGGVKIHDMIIKDFYVNGICLNGADDGYTKPTAYPVGNEVYNTIIDNCSDTTDTWDRGAGLIAMTGQQDFWIHDCILSDTSRPDWGNGDIILDDAWNKGFKYYNNTSYKPSGADRGWNFHLEIPSESGAEIYNNRFYGGDCMIDGGRNKGLLNRSYPYSYSIHDNYFEDPHPEFRGTHGKVGVAGEGDSCENMLIYNNTFKTITQPFGMTTGGYSVAEWKNIYFHNNTIIQGGVTDPNNNFCNLLEFAIGGGGSANGIFIINNTLVASALTNAAAIAFSGNSANFKNIVIANNIALSNKNGGWLNLDNTNCTMDSITVRNNILNNNANNNNPTFEGNPVTNYISSGNINSDPLLVSSTDYHLQSGSPAIGAAYPYGYGSDIGALQYTSTAPTISMSANQNITVNNTSISAVGTPASGHTITSYQWSQTQGTATIGSPTSASTTVSNLSSGINKFQCTVTQDDGQTASGTVTIAVNIPVAPTSYIKFRTPHKFINQ